MNIASMFLRILAILGAIAAGVMFWMIGDTKDQLSSELASTESQLSEARTDLSTLQAEHEELQSTAADLTRDLEETRARATNLNNQLTQIRNELAEANQEISARDREAETLKNEATRIRRELLEERNRVTELEATVESEDAEQLKQSIRELERQLLATERQIQDLGGTSTNVAANQANNEQQSQVLRGEVIEVGGDSSFVVINLGSVDGVRAESTVMIRRGPRYIGRAAITQVRNNASVAVVSAGTEPVQQGDLAVTLN